ncbi:hypothetical protein JWJ88_17190 [Paracoccus methylovorus]|uniref:Uncharacterized protein n=1 Tax=Paracoccus methylovorus TaxID=2812658 RepID=A0ABX7JM29_9RHOB|nr:hypothetical protein [Paracoccus methylovorus]QRZ14699.1 hypothetical protein JWJ88_17190 [Paracoccus methylovorus]
MIRQPTSKAAQYDFWRRTVAGERVPRFEDGPEPGFYKRRMVRGGPFVPVEIWLVQEIDPITGELTADERFEAICNGQLCDPMAVWTYCRAISAEEYDALTGVRERIPDMAVIEAALDLGRMAAIRP